jgi:hypothetical protein
MVAQREYARVSIACRSRRKCGREPVVDNGGLSRTSPIGLPLRCLGVAARALFISASPNYEAQAWSGRESSAGKREARERIFAKPALLFCGRAGPVESLRLVQAPPAY